jgi:DNA repair exonuclease SbcCD nuclease subunit
MPALQATVDAMFASDLHLSHEAPIARAEKGKDWYGVMQNYLEQLSQLKSQHNCPLFVAGDVFHHWNSPPELINFAITHMPKCIAIPGQHDLPFHNIKDIERSAFWTLVEARVITTMLGVHIRSMSKHYAFTPFPFGKELAPPSGQAMTNVAICHQYIWDKGHCFPGAPMDSHVKQVSKVLKGFNYAFFGDNHKGFINTDCGMTIVNCGGFIRRNSDEVNYKPRVWLLMSDRTVKPHYFDTSKDKLVSQSEQESQPKLDTKSFIRELKNMDTDDPDFVAYLTRLLKTKKSLSKAARQVIVSILEEIK